MVQIKKINSRRLYHYTVDTFVDLLSQLRSRRIRYKCSDKDLEAWEYFIHHYQASILGEDYVKQYLEFALNQWYIREERDVKAERCLLLNMFSKRMIAMWEETKPEYRAYIIRTELKKEYEIKVKRKSKVSELVNSVILVEEKAREKYLNTPRGLAWCIANTSLYFHRSSACTRCKVKNECREILKKEYTNTFRRRGYK